MTVRSEEPPAAELFGADAIWLSPDADEILPTPLSREHVYVISGLIDRSVIKGASLKRAEEVPTLHQDGIGTDHVPSFRFALAAGSS